MRKLTVALAFSLLVSATLLIPVTAEPPGNVSITIEYLQISEEDYKDGVGIYDSGDPTSTYSVCVYKILGMRFQQLVAGTWEIDQNMGTNLNGPAIGISDLGLGKPGGIDTLIPCPTEIGGTGSNVFITFHGVNWRSYKADSATRLHLCSQKPFSSSSLGCLAFPVPENRLWASACQWSDALFGADYLDTKGKYLFGEPFDTLLMKSDQIKCGLNNDQWYRTINYTDTIQDFNAGGASQTFDIIKNEAVVPGGGNLGLHLKSIGNTWSSTSYMAVCWDVKYFNFSNPLNPTMGRALTHDWKLIKDVQGLLNDLNNLAKLQSDPQGYLQNLNEHLSKWVEVLQRHYGGAIPGDNDVGGPAVALRGFYSQNAGNPKGTDFKGGIGVGQNGFPCEGPIIHHSEKAKKPTPVI